MSAWCVVCVCVAIVLGFIAHSFISCGFTGACDVDDVLPERYDALGYDHSFRGWDWESSFAA